MTTSIRVRTIAIRGSPPVPRLRRTAPLWPTPPCPASDAGTGEVGLEMFAAAEWEATKLLYVDLGSARRVRSM